jgi:hypothetical protein
VASSSCVKPAASRSDLSCAPNDRGAPVWHGARWILLSVSDADRGPHAVIMSTSL